MAISFVHAVNATTSTSTATLTTTLFTNTQGNCIVVMCTTGVTSFTDLAGNTYTQIGTGDYCNWFVCASCATKTNNSITFHNNTSASFWGGWALEISGLDATPFDSGAGIPTGTAISTAISTNSFSTAFANEFGIAVIASSSSVSAAPSGYTKLVNSTTYTFNAYYYVYSTKQTNITLTGTQSSSAFWAIDAAMLVGSGQRPKGIPNRLQMMTSSFTTKIIGSGMSITSQKIPH